MAGDCTSSTLSTESGSDDNDSDITEKDCKKNRIGAYSLETRSKKILKYKQKLYQRRLAAGPVSTKFEGRSKAAQ
jgi:hypothetical protein